MMVTFIDTDMAVIGVLDTKTGPISTIAPRTPLTCPSG